MKKERSALSTAGTGIFTILGIVYILPILIVLMNSFKKKVYINKQPFQLPDGKTMAGLENYMTAIDKYNLLSAVGWTVFITVGSVLVILVCTSMCAWYITRVKSKFTKMLYLLCNFQWSYLSRWLCSPCHWLLTVPDFVLLGVSLLFIWALVQVLQYLCSVDLSNQFQSR